MYKICWKSKVTGATGRGEPVFTTKKSAQDTADDFNENYPYLEHWVEYVEVQEQSNGSGNQLELTEDVTLLPVVKEA